MRKFFVVLLFFPLIISGCVQEGDTINNIIVDDKKITYPVPYISGNRLIEKEIEIFAIDSKAILCFDAGAPDIPLMNIEELKSDRYAPTPDVLSFSYPEEGKAVITKEFAGITSTVTIDTKTRTIVFSNYDHYAQRNEVTFLDLAYIDYLDYLRASQSVNSYGHEIVLDYSAYGDLIKVYKKAAAAYDFLIPLQMATDIFRDDGLGYYLYYNGNKLFYSNTIRVHRF